MQPPAVEVTAGDALSLNEKRCPQMRFESCSAQTSSHAGKWPMGDMRILLFAVGPQKANCFRHLECHGLSVAPVSEPLITDVVNGFGEKLDAAVAQDKLGTARMLGAEACRGNAIPAH